MFHNGAESQVNVQCIKHPFARTSIWLHHAPSPADFGAVLAGVNIVLLQNLRSSFFNSRKSPRDFLTIVNFLSCQSCSKTHGPGVRWLGHSQNVFFQLWATHTPKKAYRVWTIFAIMSHASLIFGAKACIETKIVYLTQSIHAKRTLQISNFANGSPIHVKQLEIFSVGSSAQQLQTKLSSQNSWLRSGQRSCSSYWEKEQLLFVPKFHAMGGADRNVVILGNCGS